MMLRWIFVVIGIVALAAGSVWLSQRLPTTEPTIDAVNNEQEGPVAIPLAPKRRSHTVSIPSLMARPLDGRELTLGRVLSETTLYTRHFITYESGELTISGVMNIPKGDGPFPVLILNHGYIDPAVYTNGRGLRREQDYLARHGFVVLHPDYRCHAQSDCAEEDALAQRLHYTVDAMNAVEAIRQSGHPKLDETRIGMLGHSMGGGVTQNVLVAKPDLIAAAVLYAPVSSDYRDSYERYTRTRRQDVEAITERYGTAQENPEFWDDLAARNFFDRVTAPIAIHHGTADESVPLEWSEVTMAALTKAGKQVTLQTYPGQPHEFTTSWMTFMERTVAFFNSQLGA